MLDYILQWRKLIDGVKIGTWAALYILDLALGIAVAIKAKTFKWTQVTDFLIGDNTWFFVVYLGVGVLAVADPSAAVSVPIVWGAIDTKLVADIGNKMRELGLPIPVVNLNSMFGGKKT